MNRVILWAALALSSCTAAPALGQTVSGCGTTAVPKADANSVPKLQAGIDCRLKAIGVATDGIAPRRALPFAAVRS